MPTTRMRSRLYSFDTVSELTHRMIEALKATASEGVAQGPYCAAKVGF